MFASQLLDSQIGGNLLEVIENPLYLAVADFVLPKGLFEMGYRPLRYTVGALLTVVILLIGMGVIRVTAQTELIQIATAQQSANVRATPSTSSEVVGSLSTGQTAEIIEENPNGENIGGNSLWYRVRLSDNVEGWVWSGVVTISEVIPTPTTTPSPTLAPNPDYAAITANNVQNLETITEWGGLGVPYLVAWSKTSDLVAVAVTGAILFYDTTDWSLIERIEDDTVNPQPTWLGAPSFEFAGDALLMPYYSGAPEYSFQLRVYSAGEPQARIISLNAPVTNMAVSRDGEMVALAFTNCAITIYGLESGQIRQEIIPGLIDQYPCGIKPLAYSSDGSRLATVDGDTVSFYDLTPEGYTLARDVRVVVGAGQSVFGPESILFNLDSTQLATFGAWQDTRLFDVERGTYRSVQVGRQIGRAALSPDGRFYAFGADILWLIDTDTGELISDLPDLSVGDFAFSPDGGQIVQVDESSGLLQVVSVPDLSVLHTIQLSVPYADADMSLDGQTLALATGYTNQYVGGHIDLYHPLDRSGAPYATIALDADTVIHDIALSPDGSQLIAAGVSKIGRESYAGFLRRYSLPDVSILSEFNLGSRDFGAFINGAFSDIAWSPDGQTLATSGGGVLRLYNTTTLQPFSVGNTGGSDLTWSPDGSRLAALSGDHIYLYEARGSLQRTLNLSDAPEFGDAIVTFSPDGQTLLSSINFDPNPANRIAEVIGLLERWDVQTGERLTEYQVPGQSEKSLRFLNSTYSPDGSLVVTSYWLEDVGYRTAFFETETGDVIRAITPPSLSGNSPPFTFFSADDALLMLVNSPEGLIQVLGIPREIQETGSFLFQDDFESGRLNQWDNRDSIGSVVIHGDDHVLRLYNYLSGYSVFPIRDSGDFGSDYAVEMDMRFRETRSETDLFLNFRETQNGSYYLVMDMDSNSVGLGSRRYGAYQDLGGSAAGVQVGQWFTVRVEASGDQLRLYIDGQLLVSAQNAVHTTGGVSFTIPPGVIVEVDKVRVISLNLETGEPAVIPTSTPTLAATPVPLPTSTPMPTLTPSLTNTPTPTVTPSPTLTASLTDTLTPTTTPSPTLTPTPTPVTLFQDNFETGDLSQWDNSSSIGSITTDGGNHILRLENTSNAFLIFPLQGQGGSDYAVEARVRIQQGTVFLNVRENVNGQYAAILDAATASAGLSAGANGNFYDLGGQVIGFPMNRWLQLRIEVAGDQIELYVNGVLIQSATSDYHIEGGISFTLAPQTVVEIDDVRVLGVT